MAAFGYTRVSTGRQAEEGESLGVQERRIEGYALMQGLQLQQTFVERGVSGSVHLEERPEGKRLLTAAQPGDVIITSKLDRMFRSALDALAILERFQQAQIALHMIDLGGDVTADGTSKMFFTILSAVAEAERDRIRERIRDVKADQKKRNRYLGGAVPFGWTLATGGELVKDEAQQTAIRCMQAMRSAGQSLRTIEAAMKSEGFVLSHASVRNVLEAANAQG